MVGLYIHYIKYQTLTFIVIFTLQSSLYIRHHSGLTCQKLSSRSSEILGLGLCLLKLQVQCVCVSRILWEELNRGKVLLEIHFWKIQQADRKT